MFQPIAGCTPQDLPRSRLSHGGRVTPLARVLPVAAERRFSVNQRKPMPGS